MMNENAVRLAASLLKQFGQISVSEIRALPFVRSDEEAMIIARSLAEAFDVEIRTGTPRRSRSKCLGRYSQTKFCLSTPSVHTFHYCFFEGSSGFVVGGGGYSGLAVPELHNGQRDLDPLALNPRHCTFGSSSTSKLGRKGSPLTAPRVAGVSLGSPRHRKPLLELPAASYARTDPGSFGERERGHPNRHGRRSDLSCSEPSRRDKWDDSDPHGAG